jgi:hypothetical protein
MKWIGLGPDAECERVAWSKPEKLALTLSIAGMLLLLGLLVHPWYDPKNDSSMYIAAARAIAAGDGYSYLDVPFHLRPPGFSLLIAPIVGILGTNFLALNLYVSLWGVAGVVLLFFHQRTRLGWPLALLVMLAVWLNPAYQRFCTQVMSDVPGTTLLLACLLLERWAARVPSWKRDLVLGASIGLAAYVRAINVLLVPAILVARILERCAKRERAASWTSFAGRLAIVVAGAWIVMVPWSVRNHFVAAPPPADQTLLYSYSTAMFHEDKGDPGSRRLAATEILQRVPQRGAEIAASLSSRMQSEDGVPHRGLALPIVACWLYVLIKRRASADVFVAGALCVMLPYFAFQDRLLVPVYMLVFSGVVEASRDLFRQAFGARAAVAIVAVALVLLIAADFKPRQGWNGIEHWHRSYEESCSVIETTVPPDVRLGSATGWHFNACLGRPVYGLKHVFFRTGLHAAVEQVIDRYRIDIVVLSDRELVDRALLSYFKTRYEGIERIGALSFIEVRPRPDRGPVLREPGAALSRTDGDP